MSNIICSDCDNEKLNSVGIPVIYIAEETSVLLVKNLLHLREQKISQNILPNMQEPFLSRFRLSKLTPREIEITELIEKEHSSLEIANLLCISKRTVDNHRQNIKRKLNFSTSRSSLSKLLRNGFNPIPYDEKE